jgi:hypothetical protein
MAFSAILGPPKVVHLGGAQVLDNTYKAVVAGGDWSAGDFLRITADSGGIEPADMTDTDGTGGIQAMAINDYVALEEGAVYKPILLLTDETIFLQQYNDAIAPAQTDVGGIRTLDLTTGKNAPTATAAKGIVSIVDIALNKKWFMSEEDICGAYGLVYFKLLAATITKARADKST